MNAMSSPGSTPAPFRRIAAAVGGSPACNSAVRTAIAIAREAGAKLVFCHVLDIDKLLVNADRSFDDFAGSVSQGRAAGSTRLRRSVRLASEAGVPALQFLREGRPSEALRLLADQIDADLIVVGDSKRGKLQRLWTGSTRDELLAETKRPLLVVPMSPTTAEFAPRCVAVATDASPHVAAVELAVDLASAYDARLVMVDCSHGDVAASIERATSDHSPDVLVVPARPRVGPHRLWPSTAERVVQQAAVPVLVVPDQAA